MRGAWECLDLSYPKVLLKQCVDVLCGAASDFTYNLPAAAAPHPLPFALKKIVFIITFLFVETGFLFAVLDCPGVWYVNWAGLKCRDPPISAF